MKSKVNVIIIALGIIFAFISIPHDITFNHRKIEKQDKTILKRSVTYPLSFIHINQDDPNLNWSYTAANYDWCYYQDGFYIIENATVNATTSPTGSGILIENSQNTPFIVRNSRVTNAASGTYDAGIKLDNTNNGTITNNNCSNNGAWGIFLYFCTTNTVSENFVSTNTRGIVLLGCYNVSLYGNVAHDNSIEGIYLSNSDETILMGNNVTLNDGGIRVSSCEGNTIVGNCAKFNGDYGIHIYGGGLNSISGNTFNNNYHGISLQDYSQENTISGNTINSNGVHGIYFWDRCDNNNISGNIICYNGDYSIYFQNDGRFNLIIGNLVIGHEIFLLDAGQGNIETMNCINGIYQPIKIDNKGSSTWKFAIKHVPWFKGSGSREDPYIIEDLTIDANYDNGILIQNSSAYFTINNCLIYDAGFVNSYRAAIKLENTSNGTLTNNNCSNNGRYGFIMNRNCKNNTIAENIATNNEYGIHLSRCDNNTISGNSVTDNNYYGIQLSHSNNNYISENSAINNNDYGIQLSHCVNITVSENIVVENQYGIRIGSSCFDNLLFYNYFVNNSAANGLDLGLNSWDNGEVGNYWDDYTGIDLDDDGIGDTPYMVAGGTGNKDYKPLMIFSALFLKPPDDFIYNVGEIGNLIKWIVINPMTLSLSFNIYRDGTSIQTGQLSPVRLHEIIINVDDLDSGLYGYTIEVNDGSGGIFTDGVWVTVLPPIAILYVEITNQSFSSDAFNITLSLFNELNQEVDSASIQMWWNGTDVSKDVVNLGSGFYFVSLNPITVSRGEDPILLNMVIKVDGYEDKYFSTYFAVDPNTLEKDGTQNTGMTPLTIIIIASTSVIGGIGIAGVLVIWLRKKVRAN